MFNIFKKGNSNDVCSPCDGLCLDITESKDQTFATKLMGDGFLVKPSSDDVCSPVSGTLTMIFPTLHAFGIKMDNGKEVLVHIGIDTVNLKGDGFKSFVNVNSNVKAGQKIISFDREKVASQGYDTSVMVIMVGQESVKKDNLNKEVKIKDVIIKSE